MTAGARLGIVRARTSVTVAQDSVTISVVPKTRDP